MISERARERRRRTPRGVLFVRKDRISSGIPSVRSRGPDSRARVVAASAPRRRFRASSRVMRDTRRERRGSFRVPEIFPGGLVSATAGPRSRLARWRDRGTCAWGSGFRRWTCGGNRRRGSSEGSAPARTRRRTSERPNRRRRCLGADVRRIFDTNRRMNGGKKTRRLAKTATRAGGDDAPPWPSLVAA